MLERNRGARRDRTRQKIRRRCGKTTVRRERRFEGRYCLYDNKCGDCYVGRNDCSYCRYRDQKREQAQRRELLDFNRYAYPDIGWWIDWDEYTWVFGQWMPEDYTPTPPLWTVGDALAA